MPAERFLCEDCGKGSLESQIYIDTRELHMGQNFLIVRRVENVLIEGIAICGILDSTPDV